MSAHGLRIAVLDDYQGAAERFDGWSRLSNHEIVFLHDHVHGLEAVVAQLAGFDVICLMRERTPVPAELIAQLDRLKLLVTTGPRNAAIDVAAAAAHGITVCGTGGVGTATPELTWALILALARRVPQEDRAIRAGAWQQTVGLDLEGKTLGILGLGRVGRRVGRIGAAFGMHLIAWSPNLTEERAQQSGATYVPRDELFAQSDMLTLHMVLSDRTQGLVGARELALMRPTALVVYTSRGAILDETALVEALMSRRIAGAALDVFEQEPLPSDHPLREAPNTVLTPHLGYVTERNYSVFFHDTVEAIEAFLAGEPIRVITP